MKYDKIEQLQNHVQNGLVKKRKHDVFDYYIYNYTPEVQYSRLWDDVTVETRGLILDGEYNVISRPFKKIFNSSEMERADVIEVFGAIGAPHTILEKMDGSLGITYIHDGKVFVATRGSFNSDQAIFATEYINTIPNVVNHILQNKDKTFLFEIIYPENKVVVDYGNFRGIVPLVIIDNNTAQHTFPHDDDVISASFQRMPEKHDFNMETISKILESENPNFEGYVGITDSGVLVKYKSAGYLQLHRILYTLSSDSIWKYLSTSDTDGLKNIIDNVPDEMYSAINDHIKELNDAFEYRKEIVQSVIQTLKNDTTAERVTKYKYVSIFCEKNDFPELIPIIMAGYDGKNIDDKIWKLIRPSVTNNPWYTAA